jgi:tRNA threonylcarbamoyladenosine modification (KEOPS) complex  Pcc1 subunit
MSFERRHVDADNNRTHLDVMRKNETNDIELLRTWTLSPTATMGSALRVKGILQELRARLPAASKKSLGLEGNDLTLAMPARDKAAFNAAAALVAMAMRDIESLPVIPREIQDILTIKASERHRWLADGRLPSAGTRTVRLNGRARKITFHVFDARVVEDLLDRGAVDVWRDEDADAKAERRQRAAYQAKLTRSLQKAGKTKKVSGEKLREPSPELRGWDDFDGDGLLR